MRNDICQDCKHGAENEVGGDLLASLAKAAEKCSPEMTPELREWFRRRENGEPTGRAPESPCPYYNGMGSSNGVWL